MIPGRTRRVSPALASPTIPKRTPAITLAKFGSIRTLPRQSKFDAATLHRTHLKKIRSDAIGPESNSRSQADRVESGGCWHIENFRPGCGTICACRVARRSRGAPPAATNDYPGANNGFDATIDWKHANTRIPVLSENIEFVLVIRRIAENSKATPKSYVEFPSLLAAATTVGRGTPFRAWRGQPASALLGLSPSRDATRRSSTSGL